MNYKLVIEDFNRLKSKTAKAKDDPNFMFDDQLIDYCITDVMTKIERHYGDGSKITSNWIRSLSDIRKAVYNNEFKQKNLLRVIDSIIDDIETQKSKDSDEGERQAFFNNDDEDPFQHVIDENVKLKTENEQLKTNESQIRLLLKNERNKSEEIQEKLESALSELKLPKHLKLFQFTLFLFLTYVNATGYLHLNLSFSWLIFSTVELLLVIGLYYFILKEPSERRNLVVQIIGGAFLVLFGLVAYKIFGS